MRAGAAAVQKERPAKACFLAPFTNAGRGRARGANERGAHNKTVGMHGAPRDSGSTFPGGYATIKNAAAPRCGPGFAETEGTLWAF